jgi:hypothetical protein
MPKASPPNVLIGGPVPISPGFPIEAFGNDGLRIAPRSKLRRIKPAVIDRPSSAEIGVARFFRRRHDICIETVYF